MNPEALPLEGWSIMLAHGRSYVGRRPANARGPLHGQDLAPVYWLEALIHPSPNGKDGELDYRCLPILMLPSWERVRVPDGAIVRHVEELSPDERRAIARAVAKVEDAVKSMRATRAGLVLR